MAGLASPPSRKSPASRSSVVTRVRSSSRLAFETAATGIDARIPPAIKSRWTASQRATPM
jgi:hypothetical protein